MATLALELALFALFSSVRTETFGQIITVRVELHATAVFSCSCPICQESTVGVHWYRSSNSDAFIKTGKAIARWSVGRTGSSQGFGITDDFSMIMYSANLTNEGLYRCIVTPAGGAAECTHDVKLGIHANPDTYPVIEYIRQANGFYVTCSISNVFPMTFPILTSKEGNGTAKSNTNITKKGDGTFNTAVTRLFSPNEKDTTIECRYFNLNFKSMSSLRIVDSDTIDQPEEEDTMENNTTKNDYYGMPPGSWMVWLILIIEVLFYIVIVYAIKRGLLKIKGNNTGDMDRDVQSRRIMWFGKLSWAVITLTIQITIVSILLVAYLTTARCLIETDGKLEGDVSAE